MPYRKYIQERMNQAARNPLKQKKKKITEYGDNVKNKQAAKNTALKIIGVIFGNKIHQYKHDDKH
jgi:hypothetical protein